MSALARDLQFASRQLGKAPGFTLTVVLTLALGIGATTAIFSLVEGILLRPLPFSNPDRLVLLGDRLGSGPNTPVTAREIGTYSSATSAFSSLGGYITTKFELSGGAIPEEVNAARFTDGRSPDHDAYGASRDPCRFRGSDQCPALDLGRHPRRDYA
jgi:hypothetical protein